MKTLPIGIQSFVKLRTNECLYVDKTKDIHRLITAGTSYFLSRPRRFGKSLLVSTIEEIFKGNRALFEGLYIYNHWNWEQQHPVIRLDFGGKANYSCEAFTHSLADFVKSTASKQNIILETSGTYRCCRSQMSSQKKQNELIVKQSYQTSWQLFSPKKKLFAK
jgi:hypothetical protein